MNLSPLPVVSLVPCEVPWSTPCATGSCTQFLARSKGSESLRCLLYLVMQIAIPWPSAFRAERLREKGPFESLQQFAR